MSTPKRRVVKHRARINRAWRDASRSFAIGLGSTLAIYGNFYNKRLDSILNTSNAQALRSDWGAVGHDMNNAIDQLKSEIAG